MVPSGSNVRRWKDDLMLWTPEPNSHVQGIAGRFFQLFIFYSCILNLDKNILSHSYPEQWHWQRHRSSDSSSPTTGDLPEFPVIPPTCFHTFSLACFASYVTYFQVLLWVSHGAVVPADVIEVHSCVHQRPPGVSVLAEVDGSPAWYFLLEGTMSTWNCCFSSFNSSHG